MHCRLSTHMTRVLCAYVNRLHTEGRVVAAAAGIKGAFTRWGGNGRTNDAGSPRPSHLLHKLCFLGLVALFR
jgi:hypothetical protein